MDISTQAKSFSPAIKKPPSLNAVKDWGIFLSEEIQVFFGSLAKERLGILGASQVEFLSNASAAQASDRLQIFERPRSNFVVGLTQTPYESTFLGREQESSIAYHALTRLNSVELYGSDGIGKTRFLRQFLASHITQLNNVFSGGIAFPTIFEESDVEDIAQSVFHCFFRSNFSFKPSLTDIAEYFRHKRFLVIYDQRRRPLSQSEVKQLKSILPSCVFFYISLEPSNFLGDVSIHLKGLPINDSLQLAQEYLGFTASNLEQQSLQEICHLLQGNPNLIIQNLSPVRDRLTTLLQVCHRLRLANSNSAYTVRPFTSKNPGLREGIISTLAVFKSYGLKESQIGGILKVSGLAPDLVALLQSSYLSYFGVLPDGIDASKAEECWEAAFSLAPNVEQVLNSEGFLFDIRPGLTYFLSLNWDEMLTGNDLSAQDIAPIVMLFRESVRQSSAYSVIAIGNILSLACLRLGLWGMRKNVLLTMLDWAYASPSKITALLSLGLQELCRSNYDESCQYLTQARALCHDSGELYFLNNIELYLDLATERKNSRENYTATITSPEQDMSSILSGTNSASSEQGVPTILSGENFPPSVKTTDSSSRKAKESIQRSFIRYGFLALSLGLISYTLFSFLIGRLKGLANSQSYKSATIDNLSGLLDLDDRATDFFFDISNIDSHNSLLVTQNRSEPISGGLLSAAEIGRSRNQGLRALVGFLPEDTPQSWIQNSLLRPAPTSSSIDVQRVEEATAEELISNVTDSSHNIGSVKVSYAPESVSSSSPDMDTENRELETSGARLDRRPEPNLSESMCRFLESELSVAEQSTNRSSDMYRVLLNEGGCVR